MKKFCLFLALAGIALIGCNKEPSDTLMRVKTIKLFLSTEETKTVNDGMSTKWKTGDKVILHYAPTGTTGYLKGVDGTGKAEVTDTDRGVFEADLPSELDANSYYDWWVFYPFNSNVKPDKTNGIVIGCAHNKSQTQEGNNSMSHLAGSTGFPLYGSTKNVLATDYPSIVMRNVASVLEYKVTNKLSEDITITGIDITAPNDLVGYWYVNYSGDEISCTATQASRVSKTAKLVINNADAIHAGETAFYYIGVAPSRLISGGEVSISITASNGTTTGTHNTSIVLSKDIDLVAGKITTLEVNYNTTF